MELITEEFILSKGFTIAELARKTGIPYSTLIKYVHLIDKRGIPCPHLGTARKIASALCMPLDEMRFMGE